MVFWDLLEIIYDSDDISLQTNCGPAISENLETVSYFGTFFSRTFMKYLIIFALFPK